MEPIYRIKNIKKQYEERIVLDIPSLDIHSGEILAIVGPSGSGKSTLLRILNFLESPTYGTIEYQGQPIVPENVSLKIRRQLTTVFQHPALLMGSVEKNVVFGLRLRGEKDGKVKVNAVIEQLGLTALAKKAAKNLSGGEAQRVALARALLIDPVVLFLDEPTANLDPYNVGLIEEVIREINHTQKTTIVFVTHNVFQAKRLANRVAFMVNGKIVEIAPKEEFFENPKDPRTSSFLKGEFVC